MQSHPVEIPVDAGVLTGELTAGPSARGLIVFAHGSGSSSKSPRNQYVAKAIQQEGLATLLFDLLTEAEQESVSKRFDIKLLTDRLLHSLTWIGRRPEAAGLPIGLFGASTGAAAALRVAATMDGLVQAVVSRGGRTDLAGDCVAEVVSPTLLIVGGKDYEVLELNRRTLSALRCEKRLAVLSGATHLFEEPGALKEVSSLAALWLKSRLRRGRAESTGAPV
jgi:alpha-beta hydrolase superfamily lysophospholipase